MECAVRFLLKKGVLQSFNLSLQLLLEWFYSFTLLLKTVQSILTADRKIKSELLSLLLQAVASFNEYPRKVRPHEFPLSIKNRIELLKQSYATNIVGPVLKTQHRLVTQLAQGYIHHMVRTDQESRPAMPFQRQRTDSH